ncbi:hypothetical protein MtrunA17_Chr2g0305601 [Medicago truncatula]|uniref:Uncharacterized protein n=1 Tax=Medicago truncatula TaxID=3880 RepID=A0A396JG05_MEDTR|nr:hypothetical protein MtrunA17_Chr2g0305601 [Medicago truncatula]
MVLVPANTSRFGFSPCKKNLLFLVPANMPYFGFGPWLHFCDDLHTWHMMTKPIY